MSLACLRVQDAYPGVTPCTLTGAQVGELINTGFGGHMLWGSNRWHAVYVLLAMYGFWSIVLVAILIVR